MKISEKNKKAVEDFGGVEALVALFGEQSPMAAVIHCIDALEPIPGELMQAAKADYPAIQWYFSYAGVAAWGRQNEAEKWLALGGILSDYRLMMARRERVPA